MAYPFSEQINRASSHGSTAQAHHLSNSIAEESQTVTPGGSLYKTGIKTLHTALQLSIDK
jgi:hypothetical protein